MKIEVIVQIDIEDLVFEGLKISSDVVQSEAWGQIATHTEWECEWDRVLYNGNEVELVDDSWAINYLLDRERYEDV